LVLPGFRIDFDPYLWEPPRVKLRTDNRGRLYGRDVLKPNTEYQAETDGNRIVLVELVPAEAKEAPLVKLIRSPEGYLMLSPADAARVSKEDIRRAVRADRDAQ
jgi:hypothetical protein